jgi:GNAT superfamily N-acetyltransferase
MDVVIKTGFENMRFDEVTGMLSGAFWCLGIGRAEVERGARNSALVLGAFLSTGKQIGYARAISDKTRFAYILDVIVHEDYRKQGVGQRMVKGLLENPDMRDVYQWVLITKDAHEVYRKVGFSVIGRPDDWMEIRKPRPDR